MPIKWIFYGLTHLAFVIDVIFDQFRMTTISQWLWDLPIPRWIPYVLGVAVFNAGFFLASPAIAAYGLACFVLGHWSRFGR